PRLVVQGSDGRDIRDCALHFLGDDGRLGQLGPAMDDAVSDKRDFCGIFEHGRRSAPHLIYQLFDRELAVLISNFILGMNFRARGVSGSKSFVAPIPIQLAFPERWYRICGWLLLDLEECSLLTAGAGI